MRLARHSRRSKNRCDHVLLNNTWDDQQWRRRLKLVGVLAQTLMTMDPPVLQQLWQALNASGHDPGMEQLVILVAVILEQNPGYQKARLLFRGAVAVVVGLTEPRHHFSRPLNRLHHHGIMAVWPMLINHLNREFPKLAHHCLKCKNELLLFSSL